MNPNTCSTDSPRFHSHLFGISRGRVHIGVLSIRLVLQSFCRPRRPGKKHAVTVNTVCFFSALLVCIFIRRGIGYVSAQGNAGICLSLGDRSGIGGDVIKRMVCVAGNPQPMKKYGEFSGNGDDCSFLAIFPAPFEHSRAPAFKIAVRTKTPQQILSALNQQRPKLFVPSLADSELLFD